MSTTPSLHPVIVPDERFVRPWYHNHTMYPFRALLAKLKELKCPYSEEQLKANAEFQAKRPRRNMSAEELDPYMLPYGPKGSDESEILFWMHDAARELVRDKCKENHTEDVACIHYAVLIKLWTIVVHVKPFTERDVAKFVDGSTYLIGEYYPGRKLTPENARRAAWEWSCVTTTALIKKMQDKPQKTGALQTRLSVRELIQILEANRPYEETSGFARAIAHLTSLSYPLPDPNIQRMLGGDTTVKGISAFLYGHMDYDVIWDVVKKTCDAYPRREELTVSEHLSLDHSIESALALLTAMSSGIMIGVQDVVSAYPELKVVWSVFPNEPDVLDCTLDAAVLGYQLKYRQPEVAPTAPPEPEPQSKPKTKRSKKSV